MDQHNSLPESLQTVIKDVLAAYEQANLARTQAQQQATTAYQQQREALQAEEKERQLAVKAAHHLELEEATGREERVSHLMRIADDLEQDAMLLLQEVGLSYILGVKGENELHSNGARSSEREIAGAFANVQTAHADLRAALFHLAEEFTRTEQWEKAQNVLAPLLKDNSGPLYAPAAELARQCTREQARTELTNGHWQSARMRLQKLLALAPDDLEAQQMLRRTEWYWRWWYALHRWQQQFTSKA